VLCLQRVKKEVSPAVPVRAEGKNSRSKPEGGGADWGHPTFAAEGCSCAGERGLVRLASSGKRKKPWMSESSP